MSWKDKIEDYLREDKLEIHRYTEDYKKAYKSPHDPWIFSFLQNNMNYLKRLPRIIRKLRYLLETVVMLFSSDNEKYKDIFERLYLLEYKANENRFSNILNILKNTLKEIENTSNLSFKNKPRIILKLKNIINIIETFDDISNEIFKIIYDNRIFPLLHKYFSILKDLNTQTVIPAVLRRHLIKHNLSSHEDIFYNTSPFFRRHLKKKFTIEKIKEKISLLYEITYPGTKSNENFDKIIKNFPVEIDWGPSGVELLPDGSVRVKVSNYYDNDVILYLAIHEFFHYLYSDVKNSIRIAKKLNIIYEFNFIEDLRINLKAWKAFGNGFIKSMLKLYFYEILRNLSLNKTGKIFYAFMKLYSENVLGKTLSEIFPKYEGILKRLENIFKERGLSETYDLLKKILEEVRLAKSPYDSIKIALKYKDELKDIIFAFSTDLDFRSSYLDEILSKESKKVLFNQMKKIIFDVFNLLLRNLNEYGYIGSSIDLKRYIEAIYGGKNLPFIMRKKKRIPPQVNIILDFSNSMKNIIEDAMILAYSIEEVLKQHKVGFSFIKYGYGADIYRSVKSITGLYLSNESNLLSALKKVKPSEYSIVIFDGKPTSNPDELEKYLISFPKDKITFIQYGKPTEFSEWLQKIGYNIVFMNKTNNIFICMLNAFSRMIK